MVKSITDAQAQGMTVTVTLRDGTVYKDCDATTSMLGNHDKVVGFWDNGEVRLVPIDLVASAVMSFPKYKETTEFKSVVKKKD